MRLNRRDELACKALETRSSKTSLYKRFQAKEGLILAILRLRDEIFRNRIIRRMEESGDTTRDQFLAMFDTLEEWLAGTGYRSSLFTRAFGGYPNPGHPIHARSAECKRPVFLSVRDLMRRAVATDPVLDGRAPSIRNTL